MNRIHATLVAAALALACAPATLAAPAPLGTPSSPASPAALQTATFTWQADGTDSTGTASAEARKPGKCRGKAAKGCRKAPAPAAPATGSETLPPAPAEFEDGIPLTPPAKPSPPAALPGDPAPDAPHASSFAFLSTDASGAPVRWSACRPLPYRVNPAGMPAGYAEDIAGAFARLGAASGLTFVDGGATDVTPYSSASWWYSVPEPGTVYVGFSDASRIPRLAGAVVGVGGMAYDGPWIVTGGLVLDTDSSLPGGFGPGSRGTMLLHELGHVVNLAHVSDDTQMMHPILTSAVPAEYGAGDRMGLVKLRSGC